LNKEKNASRHGGLAVGVPGIPAGLWELHKKYGKVHWSRLFRKPISLAQKGFRVTGEWVEITNEKMKRFNTFGKKHFLNRFSQALKPGEILKQRSLSRVLKEMKNRNIASFYRGIVARDIVNTVKQSGGVLTLKDLKNYKVRWLKPLVANYRGHKIYLMPPPSSGGVVIKSALYLMEKVKIHEMQAFSVDEFHFFGEILSRAFRGRALLGDPDFHANPFDLILSDNYLTKMAKSIDDDETTKLDPLEEVSTPKRQISETKESTETTHISVLDAKGNAIAMTITLNGNYGSGVISNRFGIALNNEMDDFTTRPNEPNMFGLIQGKGNVVEPGKRPLSSMSPTLVEKDDKIIMVLGSPGGPKIISGVLQVLYRILVTGMDMDQAIQAPRVHHQFLPHKLYIDEGRLQPLVIKKLKDRDHVINEIEMGKVYGVRIGAGGILEAAFDSRKEGAAGGF